MMYKDELNNEIDSVLNQLATIKQLYFLPSVPLDSNGFIRENRPVTFVWSSQLAENAYNTLTAKLEYLVRKQNEYILKKENPHEQQ